MKDNGLTVVPKQQRARKVRVRADGQVAADVAWRRQDFERARLLSDITAELLASDEPQRIIETICRRVMEHLDCHEYFNFLVDDEAGLLRLNAHAGALGDDADGLATFDFEAAVCGCKARCCRRMVAEHVQTSSDAAVAPLRAMGLTAYACQPLVNRGRTIGTLSFGSRTRASFAADDLELMRAVTDRVAIAMQRVRVLESSERHATEAEAANAEKSRFLAHMSHELRTPMNAILGMTDLALREKLPPSVREYLQTVKQSADGLLGLLNDILDFSRIDAGALRLETAAFDLRQTVEQAVRTVGLAAAEKGLQLDYDLSDAPTRLVGDSLRLRQVLLNLLGNAVKFTAQGGVTLRAAVASRTPEDVVLDICVVDTGIGIAPEDQKKVFAPFVQADASTTRRYGGTGLGLTIAARLVELMGGRVAIESEPGRGATVRFTARFGLEELADASDSPRAALSTRVCEALGVSPPCKTSATPPVRAPSPTPDRALRVLVAEDTPASQRYVQIVLSQRGHRVTLTSDGQEALDAVGREDFDVIVMDIQMPVLDGLQATQALRNLRDRHKANTPVIALTAHAAKSDARRCLAAGMNGYLSKPIAADELAELVERLAEQRAEAAADGFSRGIAEPRVDPAISLPADAGVFDFASAVEQCFGQYELFREMVAYLFEEVGPVLAELRAALASGDAASMEESAHRLKGTLVFLAAPSATDAARRAEALGRRGRLDIDEAAAAVHRLEVQLDALLKALTPHRPPAPNR